MGSSYSIAIDRRRKLLRIDFHGFFTRADLAGYLETKQAALAELACRQNEHVTLCNFSTCSPQSQDVLDLFKCSLEDPAYMSRRLAVVVGTMLSRLQARRVVTRRDIDIFLTVAEAEAWLFADQPNDDHAADRVGPAFTMP